MADDDTFTVTTTWQAVQAGGSDITNGTFRVFNRDDTRVELLKSSTAPAQSDSGAGYMLVDRDNIERTLGATEKLYAKTGSGTAIIGVTS